MYDKNPRRTFFKHLLSLSTFCTASVLSFNKNIGVGISKLGLTKKAHAMNNPSYATGIPDKEIKIEYFGMSCFLITVSNGTRIITDPFLSGPGGQILHPELRHEPADVVTISCGHYAHCNVCAVAGMPHVFKRAEPTEIKGITFRGVAARHLEMKEVSSIRPDGENFIICFEVEGIKICHLGALGHKLSGDQMKQVGEVDILMVPVGGVSTLPVEDASHVCSRLRPKIILPMHYRSARCTYPSWSTVDDFIRDKKNVVRRPGINEMLFKSSVLPSETQIIVLGYPS